MENSSNNKFGHWGPTSEEILQNNFPLHRACRDGDAEVLSMLLVEAQHGIYVEDCFYGWTPAHWSAYFGKLNCLMKLLENGMNCDTASMRLNQTPTHIAAFACNSHCLKWLLHCGASRDRQLACLRKLMTVTRIGADCSIKTSRFKQSPAHLSAFGDHPQCLQWLLMSGAEADAKDYLGETPVHKAARTGSMECVSLLASHGAWLFVQNNNGLTPAQLAASCGFSDCSKFLESAASRQQQSQNLGVFKEQVASTNHATPSPHDITANGCNPCALNQGLNGELPTTVPNTSSVIAFTDIPNGHHTVHTNGMSDECEMEDENSEPISQQNGVINGSVNSKAFNQTGSDSDIMLNRAISSNIMPVAGRKRCREDTDENDFKRMRKNDFEFSESFAAVSESHPNNDTYFELNANNNHDALEMDSEHEVYQSILSLSTEPLQLGQPVVPCPLQRSRGCPYAFV